MQSAHMLVPFRGRSRHSLLSAPLALSLAFPLALASCGQEVSVGNEQNSIVGGTTTTEYPAVANISVTTANGGGTFNTASIWMKAQPSQSRRTLVRGLTDRMKTLSKAFPPSIGSTLTRGTSRATTLRWCFWSTTAMSSPWSTTHKC